ncbi:MAG: amidohydrolase [Lachnospiraceae bacterium]|nr:amidohydrolase [Lachnospiraceae bacterium]
MKDFVKKLAADYTALQLTHFHHLHAYPELSFEEHKTSAYIKKHLAELGIHILEEFGGTNVVGLLDSGRPGPTIAFRADIDALPVQEETDLPYKSVIPGVMHACGHDSHTATLLAFAALLCAHPELVKGRVKFIFQCAEEKLPGGAKGLCENGVMDDVDAIYGLHCAAKKPLGEIVANIGPHSACIGVYEVTVRGKGGHGSSPHEALNPVPVACMLATAINQLLAEKASPLEKAVLTVSYIRGGKYPNIIPSAVTLGGNLRTFNNELTVSLFEQLQKTCEGFCGAYGCTCDVKATFGYPSTVNTEAQTLLVRQAAEEMGYPWKTTEPKLGGEDFSYYLLKKPGSFFDIGMADPKQPEEAAPHHNCKFQLDERGLAIALEMELAVYLKTVGYPQ